MHGPSAHRRPTALARLLFSDYVLPFEVVSVLLLAAVIGGVFLAKRDEPQAEGRCVSHSLDAYLVLSGLLFCDRHVRLPRPAQRDRMLMSIELMLNAVNLDDRRVRRLHRRQLTGRTRRVIALMVMAVAAAEATVGLAIVIAIFRNRRTPLVDEYDTMRGLGGDADTNSSSCSLLVLPDRRVRVHRALRPAAGRQRVRAIVPSAPSSSPG